MSLVARNNLFHIDRFFNDAPRRVASSTASFYTPRVDIREAENCYEIMAELPGVSKSDIQLHVEDGVLTLEAEIANSSSEEESGRIIRQERRYGKFKRSFNLGTEVEEGEIEASFTDGVLTLRAPKVVEQTPDRRRIEVA